MPERDLSILIHAAREAGKIASGYFGGSYTQEDKPGGAGPVTEADLAVNVMLEETLRAERPDYGWLSEESEDSATRLRRERLFIVDPLDGTRSFIAGETTWAHSLAIAEEGRVIAAVIYLPMRDRLYAAALSRFGLDALIDRLLSRPLAALARLVSLPRPRRRPDGDRIVAAGGLPLQVHDGAPSPRPIDPEADR